MRIRHRIAAIAAMVAAVAAVAAIVIVEIPGSAVDPEPTVRFAAAGDFSASGAAAAVLSSIGQAGTDLTLALGDLSYGATGQEQAWCDFVTTRVGAGHPFELISGNHESNGQNGNIDDFGACLPNRLPGLVGSYGRQWYADVPHSAPLVRFVAISPAIPFTSGTASYAIDSPGYLWTGHAIDAARTAGIPWVVVVMHKPCLSLGEYTCDPGTDIMNLLLSKKVDLILNGHEHLYQRTKQLKLGAGCRSIQPGIYVAACVVDAGTSLVKGAGTVSVTAGSGGQALRTVNTTDSEFQYFAASSGSNQNPTHGYLSVAATASALSGAFVGIDGSFTDSFTLTQARSR